MAAGMSRQLFHVSRLLWPFVGRELREPYAGSLLGVTWSLLQPLLFILLYWWVFAAVMRIRFPAGSALADTPFIVFLLSALLPWFAFQEGVSRAAGAILNRRDMIRKVLKTLRRAGRVSCVGRGPAARWQREGTWL